MSEMLARTFTNGFRTNTMTPEEIQIHNASITNPYAIIVTPSFVEQMIEIGKWEESKSGFIIDQPLSTKSTQ